MPTGTNHFARENEAMLGDIRRQDATFGGPAYASLKWSIGEDAMGRATRQIPPPQRAVRGGYYAYNGMEKRGKNQRGTNLTNSVCITNWWSLSTPWSTGILL